MLIATWNVNSVRARAELIAPWLKEKRPDVLLIQETKCRDEEFPKELFEAAGYNVAFWGQKTYNGVAIASVHAINNVHRFMSDDVAPYTEPRALFAKVNGFTVASVYVPNGRELDDPHYLYKLEWLDRLHDYMGPAAKASKTVVAGDFNVAPADFDVWSPKAWKGRTHVSVPERDRIAAFVASGWIDAFRKAHPTQPGYTWWNYRARGFTNNQGLRIDLALTSPDLEVSEVYVDLDARRAPKPSDHAPLMVTLT